MKGNGLRTGAEYRESLRDGRKVWVMGEGRVDDVTTHPATAAMVQEYVDWYDRHLDPQWQDVLLTPPDAAGHRSPLAYQIPMSADDLRRMGVSYSKTLLLSAGNITHDAAYGNLIALGILDSTQRLAAFPEQIANAAAYREGIAATGRYLTFCAGTATIGYRFRDDPAERAALRIVKETDGGLILHGKVGMHTSPPFAEDIYIGAMSGVTRDGYQASFIVPVNAPGVTVVCRKIAARHANRFVAPLSARFDELDGQLWMDDVFVPWERVFFTDRVPNPEAPKPADPTRRSVAEWLFWHQLYCWFSKGEFTLGVALACVEAMRLREDPQTNEYLTDLVVALQTVRSCLTAAELDPEVSVAGYAIPHNLHIATGSIAMQTVRQRLTELLRILPGSSMVVAPADTDLADPEMAAGLEESFGGGGYTALQRAALLQLAWDHIASGLDGRESAFELHCNGGVPMWRSQARNRFSRYNELAAEVLKTLDVEMPPMDLSGLREVARPQRRQVSPQATADAAAPGTNGATAGTPSPPAPLPS